MGKISPSTYPVDLASNNLRFSTFSSFIDAKTAYGKSVALNSLNEFKKDCADHSFEKFKNNFSLFSDNEDTRSFENI